MIHGIFLLRNKCVVVINGSDGFPSAEMTYEIPSMVFTRNVFIIPAVNGDVSSV